MLDSLKMHHTETYANLLYNWLNLEWKRLGKGTVENITDPFGRESMPFITPKSTYWVSYYSIFVNFYIFCSLFLSCTSSQSLIRIMDAIAAFLSAYMPTISS